MHVCALSCSVMSDCSLPGPSVHGIFQARMLEWVAVSFSIIVCRHPLEGRDAALMSVWSVSVCSANDVSKHVYMKLVSYPVTLSGWTSRNWSAGWRSLKQCIPLGRTRRASQDCLVNPTPQAVLLLPLPSLLTPMPPKAAHSAFKLLLHSGSPGRPPSFRELSECNRYEWQPHFTTLQPQR